MKKEIILWICLVLLTNSCELFNKQGSKKLDPAQLVQALEGGWKLNQSGADQSWYFSKDRTYVKISRYDEEFGTWNIDEKNITLTSNEASDPLVSDIVLDNNVLMLGSDLILMRDSTATTRIEQVLSDKLIGQWKSELENEIYEFRPNGFMLVKFADEMTEDGKWRVQGNRLIENESEFSAAPISFSGNTLQWSTETFTRIGDVDPNVVVNQTDPANADNNAGGSNKATNAIQTKGQAIAQHTFQANLGNFGRVDFQPYWEDRYGDSKVHYYLSRNGVPVYEFPAFSSAQGKFEGLRAVASRDVNSDGKLDVVVMADYVTKGTSGQESITGINGVYINKGSSFVFDRDLSRKINEAENIRTIKDLVDLARSSSSSSSSKGSTGASASASNNLSKYAKDKSICRIRVASLQGPIDYDKINKLSDLGILSFEPADNGFTRVYLGKYLGKYTAYQVLNTVKRRGHPSAFVVVDQDFLNNQGEEEAPFSTYQIASAKKIDLEYLNELADQFRGDVYVKYSGGRYKVSLGVYQKDLYPYMEQEFAGLGARLGYSDGFSKTLN